MTTKAKAKAKPKAKPGLTYPNPTNPAEWAVDELEYAGDAVTPGNINFLSAWEADEGTWNIGNKYNPLDVEGGPGPLWNSAGVRQTPTLQEGLAISTSTIDQGIDQPIAGALRSHSSTFASDIKALGNSDWAASAPGTRGVNQSYAASVGTDYSNAVATIAPTQKAQLTSWWSRLKQIAGDAGSGNIAGAAGSAVGSLGGPASDVASGTASAVSKGITDVVTSSTAIRIAFIIFGLMLVYMGLKTIGSDGGAVATVSQGAAAVPGAAQSAASTVAAAAPSPAKAPQAPQGGPKAQAGTHGTDEPLAEPEDKPERSGEHKAQGGPRAQAGAGEKPSKTKKVASDTAKTGEKTAEVA